MVESDDPSCTYVVDTSSWIEIDDHPVQNRILSALVPLIENGRIKFPPEVWDEFKETSQLVTWLSPYKEIVLENRRTDVHYLMTVGQIAHKFPGMSGTRGQKKKADPWVVGLAIHGNGNPHLRIVVCKETLQNRPNRKMPSVCAQHGIKCISLVEMLDREYPNDGWI
jgi:hypothetical protein